MYCAFTDYSKLSAHTFWQKESAFWSCRTTM